MHRPPAHRTIPAVLLIAVLATPAACSAPSSLAAAPDEDGYEISSWVSASTVVVRIHPSAQAVRDDVRRAAERVERLSGIRMVMGADATGVEPDLGDGTPEIVVVAGAYCDAPAVGCAEMWSTHLPDRNGWWSIDDARVSLVPDILDVPSIRWPILLHELGHAVGLDHETEPFLGRLQVMHPVVDESMVDYREGDRAGLAVAGDRARSTAGTASIAAEPVAPAAPRVRTLS
jgi:hypothetical protein